MRNLKWLAALCAMGLFCFQTTLAQAAPQNGWWWNAAESGRGFFIEVQGDQMFVAGYMYEANGKAVWYVSGGAMTSPTSYQGDWLQFANGQTLSGPYVAPSAPVKAGTVSLSFSAPDQATLTLSDNQQPAVSKIVPITPFLTKQPQTRGTPVATAVGVPSGSAASATIGAAGGSVSAPDGKITLTIPAGALAANTLISIQPISNNAHGGLGAGYRLTPDGQTFLQPITLTFKYTNQDLAGSDPEILGAAFQTATGFWQWLGTPTIDSVTRTMSIGTTHFTDFSMVQGYRLQPLSATLKVNESLALQVVYCYPPPVAPGDDLTPLGLSCNTPATQSGLAPLFFVSEWSVNGNVGGSGATGTVSGNGPSATYRAPASKPSPNTVAVSARVNLGTRAKTLVVSNITISDSSTYTGTVNFSINLGGGAASSGTANVTWTQFEDLGDTRRYVPSGTITGDFTLAAGCDTLHATVPIKATVPGGPGPTLVVYTASNAAFANSYQFSLAADPNTNLAFRCGNTTVRSPAPTVIAVGICSGGAGDLQPFTNEAQLAGTYSCLATGLVNATWNFTKQ